MKLIAILLLLSMALASSKLLNFNASDFESGDTIKVSSLDSLAISFPTNPSTGYNEYLINASQVKSNEILSPTNLSEHDTGDFQIAKHPVGFVGVGGSTTFQFKPLPQKSPSQTTAQ